MEDFNQATGDLYDFLEHLLVATDTEARLVFQEAALTIMTQFPSLASQACMVINRVLCPPLFVFLKSKACHDHITMLYELNPEAVEHDEGACFHCACMEGYDNETVLFLLGKYPAALTGISSLCPLNPYKGEPFLFYLLSEPNRYHMYSTETLKTMMDLNPSCHSVRCGFSSCFFEIGMQYTPDEELLHYLLEKFPSQKKGLSIGWSFGTRFTRTDIIAVDKVRAGVLVKVLPQLTKLECRLPWTMAGMAFFLKNLPRMKELKWLGLDFPVELFERNPRLAENTFSGNASIEYLDLVPRSDFRRNVVYLRPRLGDPDHALLLEVLSPELGEMRALSTLDLKHFVLPKASSLAHFIASGRAPRKLIIRRMTVESASCDVAFDWNGCRLEDFEFNASMDEQCAHKMCNEFLPLIPILETVDLCCGGWEGKLDLTPGLTAMLQRGVLKHFNAPNPHFTADIRSICKALKNNSSLVSYNISSTLSEEWQHHCMVEVLADFNTSLKDIKYNTVLREPIMDGGSLVERMDFDTRSRSLYARYAPFRRERKKHPLFYWARLNQLGRKHSRNLSITPSEFVGLLMVPKKSPHENITKIRYGLLREMPSLWTSWVLSEGLQDCRLKKRKHDAV